MRPEARGRQRGAGTVLAASALGVGLAALVLAGCSCERPQPRKAPPVSPRPVPTIRVKLGSDAPAVTLAVDGPYRLMRGEETVASGDRLEWARLELRGGEIVAGATSFGPPPLELHPAQDGTVAVRFPANGKEVERTYRGFVRLVATADGKLQTINVLPMEAYLAGVLPNELFGRWHVEAYKAQAVAARTYALAERNRRLSRAFDVYDSQQSQVYGGEGSETSKSREAVEATCGVVATCRDADGRVRLLLTQYHSTCGGATCPSGAVFGGSTPAPLAGVRCPYCLRSSKFRWTGVVLTKKEIGEALRSRGVPALARLKDVVRVEVAETTSGGRATRIRVTDSGGASLLVDANFWRSALGSLRVPSTWFTVRDEGDRIVLEDGHGFGHGVGLCQFGAEYLASHGMTGEQIVRFYYPGAVLVRAY